ncbi:hypothetical protein [Arsenicibacter rosenii]|uniref:Uncharacterized protein n=1 Tax=Arsenicibacter rosenii TaxID=1750698 RepID=A0A1S2VCT6_9BACT|nr:hypothetical protein [Arsenicibacter rosenii]OIN56577.1 hypothetical protein BLX24_24225 [Arsenicibacter rosenii]
MHRHLTFLFIFTLLIINTQRLFAQHQPTSWPDSVYSGKQGTLHVQGIAVDHKQGVIYFSFTNQLIKMTLDGRLLGSVTGLVGHLGDLAINPEDGKIYGSLEYKNDAIGRGIRKTMGVGEGRSGSGFYIAIIDGNRITKPGMNADKDDIVRTVYLREVVSDYEASVDLGPKTAAHRFGCSGIDGVAFAPKPGNRRTGRQYLYVAYGIYGDTSRTDNDHQVLLLYDTSNWNRFARTLTQDSLHRSGPAAPAGKYFVRTGNTSYGIQNLAYDSVSGNLLAAVYPGSKKGFPNYSLFVIDGHKKPAKQSIFVDNQPTTAETLSLTDQGLTDPASGVRGWHFKWGATGLCPLGNGLFYISHNRKTADGKQESTAWLYRWTGNPESPFVRVRP